MEQENEKEKRYKGFGKDYGKNGLPNRIKELRKKHGYKSQEKFAEKLGVNTDKIKQREGHKVQYSVKELIDVANLLDVDIDYILGKQEEETHEIKDLKELTGLSEEACKYLASCGKALEPKDIEKQRVEQNELLSWLIVNGLLDWLIAFNNVINNWWKQNTYNPFDLEEIQKEIDKDELKTTTIQDDVRLTRADVYYTDRELSNLIHDGFVSIGKERYKDE